MRATRSALISLAAALPLAVAGCSSSATTASSGSSAAASGGASATAAATSADPDAGLLTGSQLKTALVSTGIPAGYKIDSSGSVDTGSTFQSPSAPATGKPECANLDATGWVDLAGYSPDSFAQNDYIDSSDSAEFAQEVDAYQGSTAQDVMTALSKIATACPSFTDSSTSSTVKVSATTGTSLGDGTVTITLTDSSWQGSTTLEAVRVGQNVITVLNSAASGSGAAYATTLATAITASVQKLG